MVEFDVSRVDGDVHRHPVTAVDGVAQRQRFQPEIVRCRDAGRHLLDAARTPVAAGAHEVDLRKRVVEQGNEIVVGQANLLAADRRGNEVLTVFGDTERCACPVAGHR